MPSQEYMDYLRSPEWQQLRSQRLKIDNYKCQRCGRPFDLQVHHLYYPMELGTEDPWRDLITLCDGCHELVEHQKKEYKEEKYQTNAKRRENELKLIRKTILQLACNDLSAVGIGKRDYCNIDVIRADFGPILDACDISLGYVSRVQNYFRNRRYQVILSMMEAGLSPPEILRKTGFSLNMVNKVCGRPDMARAILKNEKENCSNEQADEL